MILKLNNITKTFGKQVVLKQINLSIAEPRLIALIAPNGSGKTTLFNIICNIETADSGSVEVVDLANEDTSIFSELTYMQDNSVLYYELTGMDHLKLVQDLHSLEKSQVDDVLQKLKMRHYMSKKVKHYSLGMKQHLLFALAILPQPRVLLMDEPLNGLDPASVVRVRQTLSELYRKGTTILFSSHNLDQIDKLTNDIYFLKNQQLVSYDQLLPADSIRTYECVTDDTSRVVISLTSHFKIEVEVLSNFNCRISCTSAEMEQIQSVKDIGIFQCQEVSKSLEQLYFELYEDYHDDITII